MDFSHDDYHEIMILGQPETVHFQEEQSFLQLLNNLTSYLGRQPMLPEWVNTGTILGVQGGTEKVRSSGFAFLWTQAAGVVGFKNNIANDSLRFEILLLS